MKNVLVTGGLGFIGFNALQLWHKIRPDISFYNVDYDTYASWFKIDEKKKWLAENDIRSFCADISKAYCIKVDVEPLFKGNGIDTVIHFAAESHVDNSIERPLAFFETNIIGTANLLELCRKHGCKFHLVSTDEVIGAMSPESLKDCSEDAFLQPSSPYSSSKASAELIAMSYFKTYGTNVTISRCTNNIGPWQHPEKMVPKTIMNALAGQKIPVYGDGQQRRFWIDVDSHNEALLKVVEEGKPGETYNIAPKPENLIKNIDLVKMILKHLNKDESLIEFVEDRPAHDMCYWLDAYKIKNMLGWEDTRRFDITLSKTISWYKENFNETLSK